MSLSAEERADHVADHLWHDGKVGEVSLGHMKLEIQEAIESAVAEARREEREMVEFWKESYNKENKLFFELMNWGKKALEALEVGVIMWRSPRPEKLDEALTWKQNDEKAMSMVRQALSTAPEVIKKS